jgi:hypothetical protein
MASVEYISRVAPLVFINGEEGYGEALSYTSRRLDVSLALRGSFLALKSIAGGSRAHVRQSLPIIFKLNNLTA